MIKKLFLSFVFISVVLAGSSQTATEKGLNFINEQMVEAQLEFLASDWTEGRQTGTRGAYIAAEYIASIFKIYGLEPGGDMVHQSFSRREISQGKENRSYRSFFQNFPLIEYKADGEQKLSLINSGKNSESSVHFMYRTDFSVYPGAVSRSGKANVVFVGYGMKDEDRSYDELSETDLEGKVILRIEGYPGHEDESSPSYRKFKPADRWEEWTRKRSKNENAAKAGVIAILEVDMDGGAHRNWAENIPFRDNRPYYEGDERLKSYYDTRLTLPGDSLKLQPPVFNISPRLAREILAGSGISIEEFEEEMAKDAKPSSRLIKNREISFETRVHSEIINARNVVGVLKGRDTSNFIVIGGHYDHLGKHDGYIWNGADDNASGTVGVMSIARACMATGVQPEKTIVFAAWTGEEKGLWGSRYFAANPYDDKNIILNLNYDMISRDDKDDEEGNNCRMTYTESFPAIEEITRKNLKDYDIDLDVNFRPSGSARGGSDHAPFAQRGIPYFYFMAGFPPEYHQVDDHIELVNYSKMTGIIKLGYLNIWTFANSDEWMNH